MMKYSLHVFSASIEQYVWTCWATSIFFIVFFFFFFFKIGSFFSFALDERESKKKVRVDVKETMVRCAGGFIDCISTIYRFRSKDHCCYVFARRLRFVARSIASVFSFGRRTAIMMFNSKQIHLESDTSHAAYNPISINQKWQNIKTAVRLVKQNTRTTFVCVNSELNIWKEIWQKGWAHIDCD